MPIESSNAFSNATRAEQLLGMPVLDRIAPEFHTVVKDCVHQSAEKGQPVASLDEQYVRLDGSRIDVAVTAISTPSDGTDVIQVLGAHIAERKQAEQENIRLIEDLTRSQQHFQALFNWTPSAVGISTVAEGWLIDVNEGFSRLTGYMREEMIGRTTLELGLWADPRNAKLCSEKFGNRATCTIGKGCSGPSPERSALSWSLSNRSNLGPLPA